jgi:hypothetical protein
VEYWRLTVFASDDVEDNSGTTEWPGFGDSEHNGALDRLCNVPKAYFWLAIILL